MICKKCGKTMTRHLNENDDSKVYSCICGYKEQKYLSIKERKGLANEVILPIDHSIGYAASVITNLSTINWELSSSISNENIKQNFEYAEDYCKKLAEELRIIRRELQKSKVL